MFYSIFSHHHFHHHQHNHSASKAAEECKKRNAKKKLISIIYCLAQLLVKEEYFHNSYGYILRDEAEILLGFVFFIFFISFLYIFICVSFTSCMQGKCFYRGTEYNLFYSLILMFFFHSLSFTNNPSKSLFVLH